MQEYAALRGKIRSYRSFRPSNPLRRGRRAPNAFAMSIVLLPLALLLGIALVATAQRTIVHYFDTAPAEYVTRESALSQAELVAGKTLGSPFKATDAFRNWGYSRWRQNAMPIWEVSGVNEAGTYLVRINGLTGRAYCLTRVGSPGSAVSENAGDLPGNVLIRSDDTERIAAAEGAARRRLRTFGLSPRRLTLLRRATSWNIAEEPCHVFLYSYHEAGFGGRTVTVTLNQRSGAVEQIWNAAGGS